MTTLDAEAGRVLAAVPQPQTHSHRRGAGAIERTLAGITAALESAIFAEQTARLPGLLQRIDPRVKVIGLLALLISVAFARNLWTIGLVYAATVVLAGVSAISPAYFIKRVWLFMPFFTGIVALPALVLTPGPALLALPLGLTITQTGLQTALFLLLRVSTSVSLVALLILTTPWNTVLKALAVLRLPEGFILILGMTHRYIYLLLHTANDMFLARKSRVIGRMSGAEDRRWLASAMGVLLAKSFHMSNEVYLAMLSRGYRGTPRTLDTFAMRVADWLALALAVLAAVVVLYLGRGG